MTHGNWMSASQQGEIAALNMLGKQEVFDDVSQYNADLFGTFICAIGDVEVDSKDSIIDVHEKKGVYKKAYLKEGKIVGAVLIGDVTDAAKIKRLIVEKKKITKKTDVFSD